MTTYGRFRDTCYICDKPAIAEHYGRCMCHNCLTLAIKSADIVKANMGRDSREPYNARQGDTEL